MDLGEVRDFLLPWLFGFAVVWVLLVLVVVVLMRVGSGIQRTRAFGPGGGLR